MQFFDRCKELCRKHPGKFIFTDGNDLSILLAARYLADEKLGLPVILGNPSEIRELADQHKIGTQRIRILNPVHHPDLKPVVREYWEKHRHEGITLNSAEQKMSKSLLAGILAAKANRKDVCLAGNQTMPPDVIKAALQYGKSRQNDQLISGFTLVFDKNSDQILCFADIAVIPRPNAEQLAELAITTARTYQYLTGIKARVALLSFSTAGSAQHEMIEKVLQVKQLIHAMDQDLLVEGELQFDAALLPEIGLKKNPENALKEAANVFIFPSLNAGNIAVHITRHLTKWKVLGPFLQGGINHVHGLSMNMKVPDIIDTAMVAAVLKHKF